MGRRGSGERATEGQATEGQATEGQAADAAPKKRRAPKVGAGPAGPRGAKRHLEERGVEFVRDMGSKGGKATWWGRGPEHHAHIGREGGTTTLRRHGPEHYARIGRMGGLRSDAAKRARKQRAGQTHGPSEEGMPTGARPRDLSAGQ